MSLLELTPPNGDSLLREARAWLAAGMDTGTHCPCCGQRAQRYRRKIAGRSVRAMVRMWALNGQDWVHLPTVVSGARADEAKLAYWGLIEEQRVVRRDDGGRAGWWRLTDKGVDFLRGKVSVPKYAIVFDSRCVGFEGDLVDVTVALGEDFNLAELLDAGLHQ